MRGLGVVGGELVCFRLEGNEIDPRGVSGIEIGKRCQRGGSDAQASGRCCAVALRVFSEPDGGGGMFGIFRKGSGGGDGFFGDGGSAEVFERGGIGEPKRECGNVVCVWIFGKDQCGKGVRLLLAETVKERRKIWGFVAVPILGSAQVIEVGKLGYIALGQSQQRRREVGGFFDGA